MDQRKNFAVKGLALIIKHEVSNAASQYPMQQISRYTGTSAFGIGSCQEVAGAKTIKL